MAKLLKIGSFDVLESNEESHWFDAVEWPEKVNSEGLGGFTDWVLPDVDTLKALYRLDDGVNGWLWSSLADADDSYVAWFVDFSDGSAFYAPKFILLPFRLVRSGQIESMRLAVIPFAGGNR